MNDDPSPARRPARPVAAALGAAAGLTLVWAAVIGLDLHRGQTDDAVVWLAVAVATLSAVLLPVLDAGRRK
ncbi:MAG: hypothetical protein KJ676_04400 [Alphaproteobacteria bacterium]|nr:hypothetical protein [Alphaproteobacteria bacterium]MBU1527146.1 hypothetical protein [Alphaproteobacteria bacterium]MBU2116619.1 hypothetical protein [Alphaproteobacteria bacterium]MBU2350658.1 hypothetical protein [Alphaproteobacteria bacterium]MBU2383275.1 hypothetical protein [Alphaproteobacteria bacterium]